MASTDVIARLRQECEVARELGYGEGLLPDIQFALDGLDIAEKAMRALAVRGYFQEHEDSWKPPYWRYDDAATQAEDEALAKWDKWKAQEEGR